MAEIEGSDIEIDVEALKRKYAEERDKRLRRDGNDQYGHLTGQFGAFDRDPHADPLFDRAPLFEDVDVLVIGGGIAGLLAGANLREIGLRNFRIVEKGADFGGTWYWNRYPGCACDVESYCYMPLLEEVGYMPTEKYASATEIFAHGQRVAEHFDLYPATLFQTAVESATWDEDRKRYRVSTDRGDRIAARFVVSCTGYLTRPKLPAIAGIESFEGRAFHTSRWDYAYTGGDAAGNLTGLADKVVGIIGSGATAIQAIPHLAASAKQLCVFQRTPSPVAARNNKPTDPDWAATLKPGWQRARMLNFTSLTSGRHQPVDLIDDSWTQLLRSISPPVGGDTMGPDELARAEMRQMELIRRRAAAIVEDPATAEALKPYYYYFCKRPCISDDFLPSFNRPNVTLVDTDGQGVERITANGVVVAGREYPLDCLILATGFDFMTDYARETGVQVTGIGGKTLTEHWVNGPRTFHGVQTRDFPNFFWMTLVQAGAPFNYQHGAGEQTRHIAWLIAKCIEQGIETIQPKQEAVDAWVDEVMSQAGPRRQYLASCTPGYFNYEGQRNSTTDLIEFYPPGPLAFFELLERWRNEDGFCRDLEAG